MPLIEGDSDPRAQEACDGWDRGGMRLRIGIQDDVYLYATLVGPHKCPSQSRRI
jgi:hypothetical protein